MAESTTVTAIITAQDRMSAVLKRLEGQVGNLEKSVRRANRGMGRSSRGARNFAQNLFRLESAATAAAAGIGSALASAGPLGLAIAGVAAAAAAGVVALNRFSEAMSRFGGLVDSVDVLLARWDTTASELIPRLRAASQGLITDFRLLEQTNLAVVLGVARSAEEMVELTDIATRLGRAMGRTAEEGLADLIVGLGRQSRLVLDNLGIIVRAEVAYERYAASLGKSASALTEAERKQAFLNEGLRQAEESVKGLAVNTDRLSVRFTGLKNTLTALTFEKLNELDETLGRIFGYFQAGRQPVRGEAENALLDEISKSSDDAAQKTELLLTRYDKLLTAIRGASSVTIFSRDFREEAETLERDIAALTQAFRGLEAQVQQRIELVIDFDPQADVDEELLFAPLERLEGAVEDVLAGTRPKIAELSELLGTAGQAIEEMQARLARPPATGPVFAEILFEQLRKIQEGGVQGVNLLTEAFKNLGITVEPTSAQIAKLENAFSLIQIAGQGMLGQTAELAQAQVLLRQQVEQLILTYDQLGLKVPETLLKLQQAVGALSAGAQRAVQIGVRVGQIFAQGFGTAVVEALDGADNALGEFAKNFLKQIAAMIIQALALAAILSVINALTGGALAAAGGGASFLAQAFGSVFGAQRGAIVPGSGVGQIDSVMVATTPGEAILPPELTDFLLEAATRGTEGPGEIVILSDIPFVVDRINQSQRRGRARVEAFAVSTTRTER